MTSLLLAGSPTPETKDTCTVKLNVNSVPTAPGHSQKKEISKSRGSSLSIIQKQIKICEQCFLCHSIVLCKYCKKCSQCCHKSTCRGQTSKLLGKVAKSGGRSEGCSNPERGLHPSLPDPAKPIKSSHSCKLLWQSSQEPQTVRGITSAYSKKCYRTGTQTDLTRVLQPTILGSQTQQQMEANPRFEQSECFPQNRKVQDGDPRNHQNLSPTGRMGNFHRLQGRLFPHSDTGTVQEIPKISRPGTNLSIQSSPFRLFHSSVGVHYHSQGEADGHSKGYKDPPIPRRLVGESHIPPGMSPAYPNLTGDVPGPRLVGEHRKVGVRPQANLQFCRLPVRPPVRSGPTDTGHMAKITNQDTGTSFSPSLFGERIHVSDRPFNGHRKTSPFRQVTHEAHSMAPQKPLENSGIIREEDSTTQILAPPSTMVARGGQCPYQPTITPNTTRSASLYRRVKRRLGRSLKQVHCQGHLVPAGKQATHKLSGTQGSSTSLKGVPRSMRGKNGSGSNQQYHSSSLHKERGRYEVRPTLCPTMEDINLVHQQTSYSPGTTHSGPAECSGRQTIQTGPDHSDRVFPIATSFSKDMPQMPPTSNRSVRHKIQQQAPPLCLSVSGSQDHRHRCTEPTLEGSGCLRLSTDSHLGQSGGKVTRLPLQETNSHCTGLAQHDLVLGSGGNVQSNSLTATSDDRSSDSALQSDHPQESAKSKPSCMAPRATLIKKQGFSQAVAARIEAPQRGSTSTVYEAKWTVFKKWCLVSQVDFRSPPVKSIADFLLYLFQDRKLQPGTIEGYRSAIADKLGNSPISKDENLTRLLDSFHRDRPKGRRGIPSWNLSLVLHQLTKPPFEPLREASLKHLTFKTVFLLALGSGKRRSEIHAWQHKNIRHQSDWSKISLYPSPSFLSKNQLAKKGPNSVAPVVIPALAPTLDKTLKSDRSLCPIRALRYYLDKTIDLRQNNELVFVSFKKGFDKDISPATISYQTDCDPVLRAL